MFDTILNEMPLNMGSMGSFYKTITNLVNAAEEMELPPIKVAYNIYKIVDEKYTLYYYKDHGIIISGVFMTKVRKDMFKISATGKHPSYIGRAPYTIELYRAIINDLDSNQVLLSDNYLTNDSAKVWKRLIKEFPGKVSVYNKVNMEVTPIANTSDIDGIFGMSPDMVKYHFMIRGQRGVADTVRIKELAGIN